MSSDSRRHNRHRVDSAENQGPRYSSGSNHGHDPQGGVTLRPANLSTKPPRGNSSSRHSGGSTTASGADIPRKSTRPRDGSTGSRHSGGTAPAEISGSPRHMGGSPSTHHTGSPKRNTGGASRPRDNSSRSSAGSTIPVGTGVSMRPGGSARQPANANSARSSNNSSSLQDIDLNLSQSSDLSVVTLGGVEYPIGSRIGTSGMFVIGDPAGFPRHDLSSASYRSSVPSAAGSQAPIYRGGGKGYNFEYWNWSVIRFVCFIFVCIVMVCLLAGIITVGIQHKEQCEAHFLWWQGSTFYNIPVPYFHDTDNSNIGDLAGIGKKQSYFEYMEHEGILLQNFLRSEQTDWDQIVSFTDVDPRLGTNEGLRRMIELLHNKDIRVVLELCPWFTSKEHSWYIESREQSILSPSKYNNFYVWRDAPDPNSEVGWEFDTIRSQYYMYLDDSSKPMLDWTNSQLVDTFIGVLEFWLQKGADGFSLCDLTKFHVETETQIHLLLGRIHDTLTSYSQGTDSQKILVIDSSYVEHVDRTYKPILGTTLERVDLIKSPMILVTDNKTQGLTSLIESRLKFEDRPERVWTLWSPAKLKGLPTLYIGALEMLNLMLPGTPSYTAGQELAQFYLEVDETYQAPLLWQAESAMPYNPGGPLPQHNLEALHNISKERKSTFSLRLDKDPNLQDAGLNYKFLELDEERDFLLLSRFYPSDNTYYYAVNLGDRDLKKDFAKDITPWATVLADSSNKYHGRLELKEVTLEPGQAIVFYPSK